MPDDVARKLGIKPGTRAHFVHAPQEVVPALTIPTLRVAARLAGDFDYLHCFVTSQADLGPQLARLRAHLRPTGMLWISWPRAGQLDTDLNLRHVIRIGYDHGLVESKTIRINDIWSALKFTHPRPGKVYHNSYGSLPPDPATDDRP